MTDARLRVAAARLARADWWGDAVADVVLDTLADIADHVEARFRAQADPADPAVVADGSDPTPPVDLADWWDDQAWTRAVDTAHGLVAQAVAAEGRLLGAAWDAHHPQAVDIAARYSAAIDEFGGQARAHLTATITTAVEQGWSIDRTAEALTGGGPFTGGEARMLARTITLGAVNEATVANYELFAQDGDVKEWVAVLDDVTRDTHVEANGQRVPWDAKFTVGGWPADAPGDSTLPWQERSNCRCTSVLIRQPAPAADTVAAVTPTEPATVGEVMPEADVPAAQVDRFITQALTPREEAGVLRRHEVTHQGWLNSLTTAQRQAIDRYVEQHASINEALRAAVGRFDTAALVEGVRETVEALHGILIDYPSRSAPIVVYRAVQDVDGELRAQVEQFLDGDELYMPGFLSTSLQEMAAVGVLYRASPHVLFEIETRYGGNLTDVPGFGFDEAEVLLPANTRFRVKRAAHQLDDTPDDQVRVTLEVVEVPNTKLIPHDAAAGVVAAAGGTADREQAFRERMGDEVTLVPAGEWEEAHGVATPDGGRVLDPVGGDEPAVAAAAAPQEEPPVNPDPAELTVDVDQAVTTTSTLTVTLDATPEPEAEPVAASARMVWIRTNTRDAIVADAGDGSRPYDWESLLVLEGVMTGDRRRIEYNALDWRTPPLSLMMQTQTAEGHNQAVFVGSIATVWREGWEIWARGYFTDDDNGRMARRMIDEGTVKGVSVDLTDVEFEFVVGDDADDDDPMAWLFDSVLSITKAKIGAATIVYLPAFEQATIALYREPDGDGAEPVWAGLAASGGVMPDRARVTTVFPPAGEPLVASAGGDGRRVLLSDEDRQRLMFPPRAWFDTQPEGPEPFTIHPDGRISGHIALDGACHIGITDRCQQAPHDRSGRYAVFHCERDDFPGGPQVICDDGTAVNVGRIITDTVHPDLRLKAHDAFAHYANVGAVAGLVRASDTPWGVYVAGAVAPTVTDEQLWLMRATPPSGDWRWLDGDYELVGICHVTVPGFNPALAASAAEPVTVATGGGWRTFVADGRVQTLVGGTARTGFTAARAEAMAERLVDVEDRLAVLAGLLDRLAAHTGLPAPDPEPTPAERVDRAVEALGLTRPVTPAERVARAVEALGLTRPVESRAG